MIRITYNVGLSLLRYVYVAYHCQRRNRSLQIQVVKTVLL